MSMVYEATPKCGDSSHNRAPGHEPGAFFYFVRGMIGSGGVVKKQQPEPKLRTVVMWFSPATRF